MEAVVVRAVVVLSDVGDRFAAERHFTLEIDIQPDTACLFRCLFREEVVEHLHISSIVEMSVEITIAVADSAVAPRSGGERLKPAGRRAGAGAAPVVGRHVESGGPMTFLVYHTPVGNACSNYAAT